MILLIFSGGRHSDPDKMHILYQNCGAFIFFMKKYLRILLMMAVTACAVVFLAACSVSDLNSGAGEKVEDLEYVILDEDRIPEELMPLIEERYEEAFQMTYTDNDYLYVCIGYGKQENSGYTIIVNDFFLGENGVLVDTSLIGPAAGEERINEPQFAYIVMRTEALSQEVPMYWK